MKLALKLAAALVLPVACVLIINGWLRVESERQFFEAETWRNHRVLARALGAAVTDVWQAHNPELARRVVADAARDQVNVRLSWLPASEPIVPIVTAAERAELEAGHEVTKRVLDEVDGVHRVTLHPVLVDGTLVGFLRIDELAALQESYIVETVLRTTLVTLFALVGCLGVSLVSGLFIVGRPVAEMARVARRVAAGDFTPRGNTRRRRADELGDLDGELERMTAELAAQREALQETERERQRTQEQLRHADRLVSVGRLSAGVAHELGTPLNVVIGRASQIADGDVEGDEARKYAGIVAREAERMSATIRKLLDFSRQRRANKQPFSGSKLLQQVSDFLIPLAKKNGVDIEVSPTDTDPTLTADVEQVEQIIVNLAVNAIDAMPKGGELMLSVTEARARKPGDEAERAFVRIRVADNGSGMAPEVRERIFDPFFTTKDVGEGTGLGLAVVFGFVQEHGGFIEVDSAPGKGSRFDVFLPKGVGQ